MLEYYSVSGCYILRPWSYSIWEEIQGKLLRLVLPMIHPCIVRLVQQENQSHGRAERVIPDVCFFQSSRARERSRRGFLPRSRMGHKSVSVFVKARRRL